MSFNYGIRALRSSGAHVLGFQSTQSGDTAILELWAGATSSTRKWRFTAGQDLFPEAAVATDATRGFLFVSGSNGVPTGVPANAASGIVPLCYDYANNDLYAYNGGWVSVSLS